MENNLYDLERGLVATLEDGWSEHEKEDEDTQREWISEEVDNIIPVYTASLLEVAINDPWLAVDTPELLAFDGKASAVSCIAGNIYAHLQEKGQEWLDAKRI